LAEGVRRIGPYDLIFCGNTTLDGSTAQVPSQLAELLGIPNVMHVCGLERKGKDGLVITRGMERGNARLEGEPPLLLSFTKEVNKPRYISFLGILEAEKKEIALWGNDEVGLEDAHIGLLGSPTKMADLLLRRRGRESQRLQGSTEEVVQGIADALYRAGLI
jgi:electron transfer flavoprotein beta subunit